MSGKTYGQFIPVQAKVNLQMASPFTLILPPTNLPKLSLHGKEMEK